MACEQREFWGNFFDECDINKDGSLTIKELMARLKKCNKDITGEQVASMFVDIDQDGDQLITKQEFLTEMVKLDAKQARTEYEKCFKKWDKDNSGKLSADELMKATKELGHFNEEEIKAMIQQADRNGDGEISYSEFMSVMCNEQSSQKAS